MKRHVWVISLATIVGAWAVSVQHVAAQQRVDPLQSTPESTQSEPKDESEPEDESGGADPTLFPSHAVLLTGYGHAGYELELTGEDNPPNNFNATFAPIFLYQIGDRFLFESEVEFEIEEGATETALEYAQIDYSLTNNFTLVFGKFLLPFNVFSERYHPSWINKLPTAPPIYGHHGAGGPTDPMLPILSDIGAQARASFEVGRFGYVTGAAFVSQGPDTEVEHEEEEVDPHEHAPPELAFGFNLSDNNSEKFYGGRLGFGIAPYIEVNASVMTGAYDDEGRLQLTGLGGHLEASHAGLTVHGEWVRTWQEVPVEAAEQQTESLVRDGYWVQLSYLWRTWEPLVRWSQLFDGDLDDATAVEAGEQLAVGLDYWLSPAMAIKAAYLINLEDADVDNDRVALQWALGF